MLQGSHTSAWVTLDQATINAFADVTGDKQFIHIDEAAARQTPFGGTIAHGFLVLSVMPALNYSLLGELASAHTLINYGCNKLRFIAPVRAGKRVRLVAEATTATAKAPGWLITQTLRFDIEGEPKPALVAEWLSLCVPK
ncbi:MaoC family dehydratase [Simiduia sp. 21SJ11W-1]|uniref:MaoC family dehydratase n=1 Tax=Simiduia sp. 21SJ11W-1 TaxID=2909669 RepID=UPI003531BB16